MFTCRGAEPKRYQEKHVGGIEYPRLGDVKLPLIFYVTLNFRLVIGAVMFAAPTLYSNYRCSVFSCQFLGYVRFLLCESVFMKRLVIMVMGMFCKLEEPEEENKLRT